MVNVDLDVDVGDDGDDADNGSNDRGDADIDDNSCQETSTDDAATGNADINDGCAASDDMTLTTRRGSGCHTSIDSALTLQPKCKHLLHGLPMRCGLQAGTCRTPSSAMGLALKSGLALCNTSCSLKFWSADRTLHTLNPQPDRLSALIRL